MDKLNLLSLLAR